ncbi:thymidylate synthase [Bacillus atrophaeus]|uniref:thymidylate synthase n=1 Tax=Bacillus atrophaeus TaxID=1452 RepID=UPI002E233B9F|nr:thymidylate synthase [Bacillus atrophaeus]
MSIADVVYKDLINKVDREGKWDRGCNVRPKWKDGTPAYTKSIINAQMKFDNSKEIPLLTQKRVPCFDPVKEILWIWRDKSNEVDRLRQMGCTVWDEWEREDGTIGRAYGWQLGNKYRKVKIDNILDQMMDDQEVSGFKISPEITEEYVLLDQVDYLLYVLKSNPNSRRIKTTLWCVEDLDDMALEPCVYETHWQLWDGKINLTVNVRSNDLGLGNPYNIYQYSILHRLIAQVTGHEVGEICFNIDNAHIYDRHMDHLKNQIRKPMHRAPKVWINPNVKSFYDFTIDDIKVLDYEHEKGFKLEVAK